MARANRSRLTGVAVVLIAVATFLAWLLWPSNHETAPIAAARETVNSGVPDERTKPRVPRQRDAAAPVAPVPPETKAASAVEAKSADAPEPTYPFDVTVLRADGTPAPGATVRLFDAYSVAGEDVVLARATTDEHGVAAMRAAESEFRVAAWLGAEAAGKGEPIAIRDRHEITLRLGPGMVVRGRVLRGDSAPEPGAVVHLDTRVWFKSGFELCLHTTTDAAGRFEFPPIPREGVDPLNPPGVEAITKDMARGFAETDLDQPDAELVVHLTPGFTARAHFIDADGQPLEVELWAVGASGYHEKSGAGGRVSLRLADAKYQFFAKRVTARCVISSRESGNLNATQWRVGRTLRAREAGGGGDVDLGDVVFAAGKAVVGHVVDAAGKPPAQAQVTIFLGDFEIASVVTDKDGRFELLEVSDEPHHLYVYADDPARPDAPPQRATLDGVRGGDPELRVVLGANLDIELHFVSDADRKPLKVATLRVRARIHGSTTYMQTENVGDPTDEFTIDAGAAGQYDVEIAAGGYEDVRLECVEVAVGRPTKVDVVLRKKHE